MHVTNAPPISHRPTQLRYAPEDEVLPGVLFGRPDELLTPAYWTLRCETLDEREGDFVNRDGSLEEEVGFCILGGYGVTVELAAAFFGRLRDSGLFEPGAGPEEADFLSILSEPLLLNGHRKRYRFPRQRAKRLSNAMRILATIPLDAQNAVAFRDDLQRIDGIGPKTASWITRNWLDSDEVAIIDVHVLRAGWAMNLFSREARLPRDYTNLEGKFLELAYVIGVRASVLDAVIWSDMRKFGSRLFRVLDMR